MVKCGPSYTVAGTIENAIYFWGTRYGTLNTMVVIFHINKFEKYLLN